MSDFKKYAIIVSGGIGSRMQNSIPKQFLEINQLPILMHSIRAFHEDEIQIILVQSDAHRDLWASLCTKYKFAVPHIIVSGGKTRFHSVKAGLDFIFRKESRPENVLISIHDGVRPLVSKDLIRSSFEKVIMKKAVVPAIESTDSLRLVEDNDKSRTIKREYIRLIQTPQTFYGHMLKEAYQVEFSSEFTDDASVIEKSGYPIHLIEGDIRNIKITHPIDIAIAELWMTSN